MVCGKPLEAGWHADHVIPHSLYGETDVINGQALCAECNLKKGDKIVTQMQFRKWQQEQHAEWLKLRKQWFMLVACPGAGKTTAMLMNARASFDSHITNFLIVVCPTDKLKTQWETNARKFGFNLMTSLIGANNALTPDFNGIVFTYQNLSTGISRDAIRALFTGYRRIFTILDEPHHLGDPLTWGESVKYALGESVHGILGSGTPFRTDDLEIPFIEYHPVTRELQADYIYGYAKALADYVVRAVFFRNINASVEWWSQSNEMVTATFDDFLPEEKRNERLRAAISADSDWMRRVIETAVNDNKEIRAEHPKAKILIITKDTRHAQQVADLYYSITKESATVVSSSEEHHGKDEIEVFANDDRRCIISVDMISEGVDVPNLRQLIYATNKTTRMYFMQAVGRVVRVIPGCEEDNAYVYIPSDHRLLEHAQSIKQDRLHVLLVRTCRSCGKIRAECTCTRMGGAAGDRISIFSPIKADAIFDGGIYDQERYEEDEISAAKTFKERLGFRSPVEEIAKMRKFMQDETEKKSSARPEPEVNLNKQRETLRALANSKAAELARLRNPRNYETQKSKYIAYIHAEWKQEKGGESQDKETIEGLKRKIEWLNRQIERWSNHG